MNKQTITKKVTTLLLLIIIPSIVTLVLMFVENKNNKSSYVATTKILVQPTNALAEIDKEKQELFQKLTYVVADLADDSIVLDEVISRYAGQMTITKAKSIISATPNPNSQAVLITATHDQEAEAKKISIITAQVLKDEYQQIQGVDLIQLVDVPSQAKEVKQSSKLKLLVTFVGTLFLLLLLYFIIKF